jgi:hypothetical protein
MVIWDISFRFGILYQEKSGNPVRVVEKLLTAKSLHRALL